MAQQDIHGIPDVVAEYLQDHGITDVNIEFPLNLFIYDVIGEGTGEQVASQAAFIQSILALGVADVALSLAPSTLVQTTNFSINAKFVSNKTSYDNKPQDAASFVYSQERPTYLIDRRLDIRDKFIVFSQESIYTGDDTTLKVSPNIPIFLLDSETPIYDVNGVFQYSLITLKKFISYKIQQTSENTGLLGPYKLLVIEWFKADIQPRNAIRRRITFKSRPWIWFIDIKDDQQTSVNWISNDTGTEWNEDVPLPIIRGTKVGFSPVWSIEKAFIQYGIADNESFINGSGFDIYDLQGLAWDVNPITGAAIDSEQGIITPGYNDGVFDFLGVQNGKYGMIAGTGDGKPVVPHLGADLEFPIHGASKGEMLSTFFGPTTDDIQNFLFSKSNQVFNYILPFSSTGIKSIAITPGSVGNVSVPRKVEQLSAPWLTFKDESLVFFDAIYASLFIGVIGVGLRDIYSVYSRLTFNNQETKQKMIDAGGTGDLPSFIGDYTPYLESDLRRGNKDKLLKRNLTWMAETISTLPPDIITETFDFSPLPTDWNKEEMKKYLALYPSEKILEIDGNNLKNIIRTIPVSGTDSLDMEWQATMAMKYRSMVNTKSYQMTQDFYINENGAYIIEIEYPNNIDISFFQMNYFGGYEYVVEDFQNTKAEADSGEGDIPCTFDFQGVTYDLPAFTYDADNRRTDPRTAVVRKLYGGGALKTSAQGILKKSNQQSVRNNEKKLINIETGKMIKNTRYKKKGK